MFVWYLLSNICPNLLLLRKIQHANNNTEWIWKIQIEQILCLLNWKLEIFIVSVENDLFECSKDLDIAGFVVGTFHLWIKKMASSCDFHNFVEILNRLEILVGIFKLTLRRGCENPAPILSAQEEQPSLIGIIINEQTFLLKSK